MQHQTDFGPIECDGNFSSETHGTGPREHVSLKWGIFHMDEGSCQKGDIVGSKTCSSKSKTRMGNVDNDTFNF